MLNHYPKLKRLWNKIKLSKAKDGIIVLNDKDPAVREFGTEFMKIIQKSVKTKTAKEAIKMAEKLWNKIDD